MNNLQRKIAQLKNHMNQHGSVVVIVTILLVALIGMVALAVDIGYVAVSKNELQNAADAAALAGAGKLGQLYAAKTPPLSLSTGDPDVVVAAALSVGGANKAAGLSPNIENSDIEIDYWDLSDNRFKSTPTKRIPNAVRVTARPSASVSTPLGSVRTFFASIFGKSNVAVSATATASLSSPCTVKENELAPFVIAQDSSYCNSTSPFSIDFSSNTGCGGWHSYFEKADNPQIMEFMYSIMNNTSGCINAVNSAKINTDCCTGRGCNSYTVPSVASGNILSLLNGNASSWNCLQDLYNCKKDAKGHWFATVAVVKSNCSTMKNGTVVSFATIDIQGVATSQNDSYVGIPGTSCGKSCVTAFVQCDNVILEKGQGCAYYGTYGSIPGLVDKSPPS